MFDEFLSEVFFIKIKVKGYLKNITENTIEKIDTSAIKNKNKISYIIDNTKYRLDLLTEKIILKRESNEFIHSMVFKENKETKTEYYIKTLNTSLDIKILTTKINITDNKIEINYKIIDSNSEYIYLIEMSDK